MLPLPNRPVPAKPQKNMTAATNSVLRTPILALDLRSDDGADAERDHHDVEREAHGAFSRPNVVQMGAANMENA